MTLIANCFQNTTRFYTGTDCDYAQFKCEGLNELFTDHELECLSSDAMLEPLNNDDQTKAMIKNVCADANVKFANRKMIIETNSNDFNVAKQIKKVINSKPFIDRVKNITSRSYQDYDECNDREYVDCLDQIINVRRYNNYNVEAYVEIDSGLKASI